MKFFKRKCGAYDHTPDMMLHIQEQDQKRVKNPEYSYVFGGEICDGYYHSGYDTEKGGLFAVRNSNGVGLKMCDRPRSLK